jgi:hypothetical protein
MGTGNKRTETAAMLEQVRAQGPGRVYVPVDLEAEVFGHSGTERGPGMLLSRLFSWWDANVRSWLRYRLLKRHRYHLVDTGLTPGYYDQDNRMLHACFALLVDYVDELFHLSAKVSEAQHYATPLE